MVIIKQVKQSKVGQKQVTIPKNSEIQDQDYAVILTIQEYLNLGGKL